MRVFRSGRTFRTVQLTILASVWAAGWARTGPRQHPPFRFDIRRYDALLQQITGDGEPSASKLVEQRRAAVLAAAAQTGRPQTTVLRLNQFGLPEAVLHVGGVPTAGPGAPLALAISYLRSQSALFPCGSGPPIEPIRPAPSRARSRALLLTCLGKTNVTRAACIGNSRYNLK